MTKDRLVEVGCAYEGAAALVRSHGHNRSELSSPPQCTRYKTVVRFERWINIVEIACPRCPRTRWRGQHFALLCLSPHLIESSSSNACTGTNTHTYYISRANASERCPTTGRNVLKQTKPKTKDKPRPVSDRHTNRCVCIMNKQ